MWWTLPFVTHLPASTKTTSCWPRPQCKPSRGRKRGICWCVDKYGVQLPGTDYSGGDIQCKDLDSSNNNEWKGEDRPRPPPPPPTPSSPPPPLTTMWPRTRASSLNHTRTLRPPFTSKFYSIFFFKLKKKGGKKIEMKEQAEKGHLFFFYFFSFLLLTKHSSPNEGKRPRRFTTPLDCSSWDPLNELGRLVADLWKYMHTMDIFLYRGFNTTLCMI